MIPICLAGLALTYLPEQRLFSFKYDLALGANVDVSYRYTAISLIGLRVAARHGHTSTLPLDSIEQRLIEMLPETSNPGDIGLVLWACVEASSTAADVAFRALVTRLEERTGSVPRHSTMELSWCIVGLSRYAEAHKHAEAGRLARVLADELLSAFNPRGRLFTYLTTACREGGAKGPFHRRFGSFANQIYPILALSTLHRCLGAPDALRAAERCAARICELQGPMGQWWWTYDVPLSIVAEKFPVFSVHQDAMAPMGLHALHLAGGRDYSSAIAHGFRWLYGDNELGLEMVHESPPVIARAIQRRGVTEALYYGNIARSMIGARPIDFFDRTPFLALTNETRSYHLGWALYYLCPLHPRRVAE